MKLNKVSVLSLFIFLMLIRSDNSYGDPIVTVKSKDLDNQIENIESVEADPKAKVIEELGTISEESQNISIVLDSSGSMGQILEKNKTKMFYLKKMMKEFIGQQWKLKNTIGMRVYGSRQKKTCNDIVQAIPYSDQSLSKLEKALQVMSPLGMTPLHKTIDMTVDEIKKRNGPKKILIVTDGEDTCGGDPCKTSEKIKKDKLDITFYVIALGFQGNSDALKKLSCMGDVHLANDSESFSDAVTQISGKINKRENLKVISPNPGAPVYLYSFEGEKRKLERIFYASEEQTVPPGDYEAVVMIKPPYKFQRFHIPPARKVVLQIEGEGQVLVNFFDSHLKAQILDKNNRVVVRGKSDIPFTAPTGKWRLRIFKEPFYEQIQEDFFIYPNNKHTFDVVGAGVLKVDEPETQGVYVYDSQKNLMDYTLTGSTFVLRSGVYSIHVNDKCTFDEVPVRDKKEVVVLPCPH